jgi:5-methylcytosine-specific restriction endonuclease McrA
MTTHNNIKRWRAAHPEKQAEYHKRWEASPKGTAYKARQRLKDHWAWARKIQPSQAKWAGPWITPSGRVYRGGSIRGGSYPRLLYDCHGCGKVFLDVEGGFGPKSYCSRECHERYSPTRDKHYRWAGRMGRARDRGITRREVLERDQWTCHICKQPIPDIKYDVHHPSPLYGTRDHVVPKSDPTGSHTWDNVRAAHRSCNTRKGGARKAAV